MVCWTKKLKTGFGTSCTALLVFASALLRWHPQAAGSWVARALESHRRRTFWSTKQCKGLVMGFGNVKFRTSQVQRVVLTLEIDFFHLFPSQVLFQSISIPWAVPTTCQSRSKLAKQIQRLNWVLPEGSRKACRGVETVFAECPERISGS